MCGGIYIYHMYPQSKQMGIGIGISNVINMHVGNPFSEQPTIHTDLYTSNFVSQSESV